MLAHLPLTFRHRAGVRPYTSSLDFAESCVFSKQSPPPLLCHSYKVAFVEVMLIPKLRMQFAEFLQYSSLKRLGILYQSTCVGLGYGQCRWSYFQEPAHRTPNPIRGYEPARSVTTIWFTNINVIPIGYAFLPHLRGRLTLR